MSKYSQLVTLLTSSDDTNFELGLRLVLSTVRKGKRGEVLGALLMALAHSWANAYGYETIRNNSWQPVDSALRHNVGGFSVFGLSLYPTNADNSTMHCKLTACNTWLDKDVNPTKSVEFVVFFLLKKTNIVEPTSNPSMTVTWNEETYWHKLYTEDVNLLDKWAEILLNGVKIKGL